MSSELLFTICNCVVLPGWVALLIGPRWRFGVTVLAPVITPTVLAVIYGVLLFSPLSASDGSFMTLAGVQTLFENKWLLLAGWIHYLAFDLFIASWEVRAAERSGMPHWSVILPLLLTFMSGPVGLGLFLLIRGAWKKKWAANEEPAAES